MYLWWKSEEFTRSNTSSVSYKLPTLRVVQKPFLDYFLSTSNLQTIKNNSITYNFEDIEGGMKNGSIYMSLKHSQ